MFRFWKKNARQERWRELAADAERKAERERLDKLANEVEDVESFLRFAQAFLEDRYAQVAEEPDGPPSTMLGNGSRGWNNHTIEDFLEAALAWANDQKVGMRQELEGKPPWLLFADFLYAGKVYE